MAGVAGRSGRRGRFTKEIESLIGDNRYRACNLVNQFLRDKSIPLQVRVQTAAMPIVSKLMPDKQEILSLSVSLSPEQSARLIEVYERNLLVMQELRTIKPEPKPEVIEVEAERVETGTEGGDMSNQHTQNGPYSK